MIRLRRLIPLLLIAPLVGAVGCSDVERALGIEGAPPLRAPDANVAAPVASTPKKAVDAAPVVVHGIEVFIDGGVVGHAEIPAATDAGYTVIDLGDDFTPFPLTDSDTLAQPYRPTFLALADEKVKDEDWREGGEASNLFLELYGIFPTLRVVRTRFLDNDRQACHVAAGVDILQMEPAVAPPWDDIGRQRARVKRVRPYLSSKDGDVQSPPQNKQLLADLHQVELVKSVQAHLRCDGLLRKGGEEGVWDERTQAALRLWQRQHMIIAWGGLTKETRAAMVTDNRELIFRDALRVLRERVMDATGIIEDGSAIGEYGRVVGRVLDPMELRTPARKAPMPGGAPDLLSMATDAAARALGWTGPEGFEAWLRSHTTTAGHLFVALPLPPRPRYHSSQMDLYAEVDRGDVFYDFPYNAAGKALSQHESVRPALVLYARTPDGDVPLLRWNTTIGGWKRESLPDGQIGMKYKESEWGDRVWRDVIAAPAWIPPETTPPKEIARKTSTGWVVNSDEFGPGFRSAYGLVMFINSLVSPSGKVLGDHGIRVHGSVNYRSILGGQSHGCHRLFNHLAIRLSTFALEHRAHTRHGNIVANYQRDLSIDEETVALKVATRGYRFELTPPIPVKVLEGTVRGEAKDVIADAMPLPEDLQKTFVDGGEEGIAPALVIDAGAVPVIDSGAPSADAGAGFVRDGGAHRAPRPRSSARAD